ncbi:hypothetical protein BDZ45DRAFT_800405 [Acephala macrosclerotiorum]|nr:hypothetical protein BDZ45DRAFT_800405 [Acephala macrosclerotiorum]
MLMDDDDQGRRSKSTLCNSFPENIFSIDIGSLLDGPLAQQIHDQLYLHSSGLRWLGWKDLLNVFPLRIEVVDRPGLQSTVFTDQKGACHIRKKTKFDGPKIWGHSDTSHAQIYDESLRFTDHTHGFGALIALRRTTEIFETVAVSQNATDVTAYQLMSCLALEASSSFLMRTLARTSVGVSMTSQIKPKGRRPQPCSRNQSSAQWQAFTIQVE